MTVPIVDFLLAFVVLFGMMVWFDIWPSFAIVLAPLFLVMAFVAALGVALFLSAVNVRYRDVPYAIPFLHADLAVSLGRRVRDQRAAGALAVAARSQSDDRGHQRLPVGSPGRRAPPDLGKTLVSVAATAVFLVVGLWYFRRSEPRFADTI